MAEAEATGLVCVSGDCQQDAVKFCNTCKQAFCVTHDQAHTEFLKVLKAAHEVITVEEYRRAQRQGNSCYCTQHQNTPIFVACHQCYKPLCAECIDDSRLMKQCSSTGKEQHETRSLKQVSQKIQRDMSNSLSELKIRQMKISDGMKERRQLFDEQMEENRGDLDKLAAKVEELHELVDNCYKEWKQTLVDHMSRKKGMMDTLEAEFDEYQKSCQQIYDRADQYKNQSDVMIVNNQWDIKSKLESMSFQFNDKPEQFVKLSLKVTGDAVNFPISFQTERPKQSLFERLRTGRIPTSIEVKQEITTPLRNCCVNYSRDGCLLHAGDYQLSGLEFTLNPTSGTNMSLSMNKSSLYVLLYANSNYHVHVVNLTNRSLSSSIISFSCSYACYQHMSVTDKHIVIAHRIANTIKVYSTTTYNHMFDIKDTSFSSPWGLAVLGDTLVVGSNGEVVNITVSQTPEVRWSTGTNTHPLSIEVKRDSQIILVGCTKQVLILSYQGEKLSTLDLSGCSRVYDLSTYQNQLAVSDYSTKIKVYEMKYQERDN